MLNAIKKIFAPKEVDFSSILCVYKSQNRSWRGFADPYDVTIEADTKEQAVSALREMVATYEEIVKKYNHPSHLIKKRLSDSEDEDKFREIVRNPLLLNNGKVEGADFYAETVSTC